MICLHTTMHYVLLVQETMDTPVTTGYNRIYYKTVQGYCYCQLFLCCILPCLQHNEFCVKLPWLKPNCEAPNWFETLEELGL